MSGHFVTPASEWLNEPEWHVDDDQLTMHAVEGSDFWQHTSYGFVRDTGHALLHPVAPGQACEVDVRADMSAQFDQAGLVIRMDPTLWLKTGLELADGTLGLSAVHTHGRSDWSTSPVPEWTGQWVRLRISVAEDSLTVRARREGDTWRLVRLVPFAPSGPVRVGPYACSPSRAGYVARFRDLAMTAADGDLH